VLLETGIQLLQTAAENVANDWFLIVFTQPNGIKCVNPFYWPGIEKVATGMLLLNLQFQ
jgi:hypothetical protein